MKKVNEQTDTDDILRYLDKEIRNLCRMVEATKEQNRKLENELEDIKKPPSIHPLRRASDFEDKDSVDE